LVSAKALRKVGYGQDAHRKCAARRRQPSL
jgi:hypothetical protein